MFRLFVAATVLFISGCTSGIDAASFNQSCRMDSDCVSVFSGDHCAQKCGDCDCPNSAIARDAFDDYENTKASMLCAPEPLCPICDCLGAVPACVQSQCSTLE